MAEGDAPPAPAPPLRTRSRQATPSRLRTLLTEQRQASRDALRGIRPARLPMVLVGIVIAAGVVLAVGFLPITIQRIFTIADDEMFTIFFTALTLTLLAQSALTYLIALLLAYTVDELFAPRNGERKRGPRATVWRSLHRLGNATSITLVLTIAGTAIGILALGIIDQDIHDTPAELAGVQLGTLLFILVVALAYESVRVVVDMLAHLPATWRWGAAFLFPCLASIVVWFVFPADALLTRIVDQWAVDGADVTVNTDAAGDVWGVLQLIATFAVLWTVYFVASGQARRLREALRG